MLVRSYMSRCLLILLTVTAVSATNHCCSYPCQNGGVCVTEGFDDYSCDCSQTEHYGRNCEYPTLLKHIKLWFKPGPDAVHYLLTHYKWIWDIINSVEYLSHTVMQKVYMLRSHMVDSPGTYTSAHEYITLEAAHNTSYFTRALPPVPKECPTPLGVVGKKQLPDPQLIVDKFFIRTKFIPETLGSSVLFSFFAQHFTHQFFKTDLKKGPGFQWGGHGVDVSHIYGKDKGVENSLRSFRGGKLKVQVQNGEDWPPYSRDLPDVPMTYMPHVPQDQRFALGHEFFGLLPGLFVYATIWVREHNRVCDVLTSEHPEWVDEQIFQTAKLVILGETIKIVIEDYVQHLSHYHYRLVFEPELLFGQPFQYQNRIAVEFNHLYHWHPLMPDEFNISGTIYPMKEYLFHSEIVMEHGMKNVVDGMSRQVAGKMSHHNHGHYTLKVAMEAIVHGRELRLQSLNQYRKRFGLKAFKTFEDLTGDVKLANELEDLYGDVDAVEFYVGLMLEKHREDAMFPSSIIEIGGPFSVKGLMSNAICSPKYWRPSTFGGEVGFNIVKTATLKKLFCQNINGDCPLVSFRVPKPAPKQPSQCENNCSIQEEL